MKERRKMNILLTATGGMVTAVSFVICLMGCFTSFTSILFPAACGIILVVVMRYVSSSVAVLSYVATSLLLLFFSPDRLTALAYTCALGYYPMAFRFFAGLKSAFLRLILKTGLFALIGSAALFAGMKFFGLAENELFIKYGWLLVFFCCLFLILYDRFIFVFYHMIQGEWDEKLKKFFHLFR